MTRRLAWLNEKGGSGKSTSALNVAANLASRFNQSVLLVDVDHQANVTTALSGEEQTGPTLTQVLIDGLAAAEAIRPTQYEHLHLLPADGLLADVNIAMGDANGPLGMGREMRLKRALEPIESKYDFVIIDTSPQRTLLNINVLNYVDEIFVPIDPGYWSIMGVRNLEELLEQVRVQMRHERLRIGGVLLTKAQRTNVAHDLEKQVRQYFGDRVLKTVVPLNVKVEEAHSRGIAVLDYAPDSPGAKAYLAVTEEILGHHTHKKDRSGRVAAVSSRG